MKKLKWERCFSRMVLSFALIAGLIFAAFSASGQAFVYTKDNIHEIPDNVTLTSKISEMKYNPKLLGTNYLDEEWAPANVTLAGDTIMIQDVNTRLDITNGVIEIRVDDKVMVVPSYKTHSIAFVGRSDLFLSRSGINLYGPVGFYKVLYENKLALYCHYSTEIKESNYNVALDAGRMDDELRQVKTYYLVKGNKLVKLEKKKGKLINQLGGDKLEAFIKENGVDVKTESGLISIVEYLDGNR